MITRHLRDANAKTIQMLIGQGIQVTQRGSGAHVEVDPQTLRPMRINIPFLPDDAPKSLVLATQGYMDHEASHCLFTDWTVRARAEQEGLAASHNLVEDCFVEWAMASHFPGSSENIDSLHNFFATEVTPTLLEDCAGNTLRELEVLAVPAVRALAEQTRFVTFMADGGHWDSPVMQAFLNALDPAVLARMPVLRSSAECLEVARSISTAIRTARAVATNIDHRAAARSRERSRPGSAGSCADAKQRELGSGSSNSDAPRSAEKRPAGEPTSVDRELDEQSSSKTALEQGPDGNAAYGGTGRQAATPKGREMGADDEGQACPDASQRDAFSAAVGQVLSAQAEAAMASADYRILTRDLDKVEVFSVDEERFEEDWLTKMEGAVAQDTVALQNAIERSMASRSANRMLPGFRSGRLHAGALHRLFVGNERVFRQRHVVPGTNTALSLLVDSSGSMQGEKLWLAMTAAYALAHCAERVGIPCETLGFTTSGEADFRMSTSTSGVIHYSRWVPLYIPIFKRFDERMRPAVRRRFAAAAAMQDFCRANIDGECILIACTRLLARREPRKLLLVLSDGQPSGGRQEDLQRHLHRTVADVAGLGIELVGIGIGDDAVATFYPRSFTLDDVARLPAILLGELQGLLAGTRPGSMRSRRRATSNDKP